MKTFTLILVSALYFAGMNGQYTLYRAASPGDVPVYHLEGTITKSLPDENKLWSYVWYGSETGDNNHPLYIRFFGQC